MREIKFRAIMNKEWKYYSLGDFVTGKTKEDSKDLYFSTDTWSQFIGLKDKNGVDIYEGDIVEFNNGFRNKIEWNTARMRYCVFGYYQGSFHYEVIESDTIQLEVIGNIYQNKELLKYLFLLY